MQRGPNGQTAYTVYPVSNYTFGTKNGKSEKDKTAAERLERLKTKYESEGMRRSVEGVVLVQQHGHPHVLLLSSSQGTMYKLPGGRLRVGEDEAEGLKRKLTSALSPTSHHLHINWDVGECVGTWWRPNYDTLLYPYVPPHITRPKECQKLFVVPLPEKACFQVPRNWRLVAVPLFELYDHIGRYGPIISSLPQLLSRLRLNLVAELKAEASLAPGMSGALQQGMSGQLNPMQSAQLQQGLSGQLPPPPGQQPQQHAGPPPMQQGLY